MSTILAGEATPAQLIGFCVALQAKGETPEELAGLLDAVLEAGTTVTLPDETLRRAIDIGAGETIDAAALKALVRAAVALNAAAGAAGSRKTTGMRKGR